MNFGGEKMNNQKGQIKNNSRTRTDTSPQTQEIQEKRAT